MFSKILIANRGEIAVRIIRACKELGIKTVAIYSEIDKNSLHVHMADESICIGPALSYKSYLNYNNIISAALSKNVDAIHPGYGFLSENADFVKLCRMNNVVFIGPEEGHIRKMGNKSEARKTMTEAGVPIIPGSETGTNNANEAIVIAKKIGFPVMIKASSGGGGRGIRIVYDENKFEKKFNLAKSESLTSFNSDLMYIEKYLLNPRHIEFQILSDKYGNIIHLGERDCSLQRRNQKVLEEAPCNIIDRSLRDKMGKTAIDVAKSVQYIGAGTVEFLLDTNNNFYFIEMNTRVQVEHPVTEFITGVDLIKEQIKIAYGMKLDFKQQDIDFKGHSIECRINAEDVNNDFKPCPGVIEYLHIPGGNGIRFDSHIYSGYTIPAVYDSMIGKLIVWGRNREEAINKMKRGIEEIVISGVKTNIDLHSKILVDKKFIENDIDTSFINDDILK